MRAHPMSYLLLCSAGFWAQVCDPSLSAQALPLRTCNLLKQFAGKTTLLRHLLENTKLKIGCIVNDVAAVNVDAKLIRNDKTRDRDQSNNTTSDLADTIELANGCACKYTAGGSNLCLPAVSHRFLGSELHMQAAA